MLLGVAGGVVTHGSSVWVTMVTALVWWAVSLLALVTAGGADGWVAPALRMAPGVLSVVAGTAAGRLVWRGPRPGR